MPFCYSNPDKLGEARLPARAGLPAQAGSDGHFGQESYGQNCSYYTSIFNLLLFPKKIPLFARNAKSTILNKSLLIMKETEILIWPIPQSTSSSSSCLSAPIHIYSAAAQFELRFRHLRPFLY